MNETRRLVVVPAHLTGVRLDKVLALQLNLPRAQVARLWQGGLVRSTSGRPIKPAAAAAAGEQLVVDLPPDRPAAISDFDRSRLHILHEDEEILVLDKPPGLTVHPTPRQMSRPDRTPTLAELIVERYPDVDEARYSDAPSDSLRAGLVHRLDKDTSGVIVIARTRFALEFLKGQFQSRNVQKEYRAVCFGHVADQTLDAPLGQHPSRWWLRAVVMSGKPAQTEFAALKAGELMRQPATFVAARPRTGRTHQIRVHLQHLGCPILGDSRYATTNSRQLTRLADIPRLMLHAASITITHPATNRPMTFSAPLPPDLASVAQAIIPV